MKKKILITGGTGFIGSHLCELCVRKGFKVTSFDRYNTNYSLGNLKNSKYEKDINFIFGDIRDRDSVEKARHRVDPISLPLAAEAPREIELKDLSGTHRRNRLRRVAVSKYQNETYMHAFFYQCVNISTYIFCLFNICYSSVRTFYYR